MTIQLNREHLRSYGMITLMLFLLGCAQPTQQNLSNTDINDLKQSIAVFNEAFQKGDVATLNTMITDNYQHTNSTSKAVGKDEWFSYLETRQKDIDLGRLIVDSYSMEDLQIETYGETAIVTAKIVTQSTWQGRTRDNEYRVTNIWVLDNGQWKRAGFHDGKIK